MSISVCITHDELKKALAAVELAQKQGFMSSTAVLSLINGGRMLEDCQVGYDSVVLKAHPIDPYLDWGRTKNPEWHKFENGKCVDVDYKSATGAD